MSDRSEARAFADRSPQGRGTVAGQDAPPAQIGRYRILRRLGTGGMGSVYLAHDSQLDRAVALKLPHLSPKEDADAADRFLREARAAATLTHPNLCPVYDAGHAAGRYYLSMAYVEGRPLSDYVTKGQPLPPRQAAILIRKLARALDEAHQKGVVHRDLKPANILINHRREPVIIDFGLAIQAHRPESRLTKIGSVLGTPAYMAPEQIRSRDGTVGPAADVYSLAVVLYELLTGEPPFAGPVAAVLGQVLYGEPAPPRTLRPDLDPQLESICLKAMARQPQDRFASMAEFAGALSDYLKSTSPSTKVDADLVPLISDDAAGTGRAGQPVPTVQARSLPTDWNPWRHVGPARWLLAGAVMVTLALAVGLAWVVSRLDSDPLPTELAQQPPEVPLPPAFVEAPIEFADDAPALVPPPWIDVTVGKEPVPDAASRTEAEARLLDELRERLATDDRDLRRSIAEEQLRTGANVPEAPAVRFARLVLARRLAVELGQFSLGLEACAQLARYFAVDDGRMKAALVTNSAHLADARILAESWIEAALATGFEGLATDDYRYLRRLARLARSSADEHGFGHLVDQADLLERMATTAEPQFARLAPFVSQWAAVPDDPEANRRIGQFLAFAKNDWRRASPFLCKADDADLRTLAEMETAPAGLPRLLALGDGWWALADRTPENATACRIRARYWYLKTLAKEHADLTAEVRQRITERIQSVPATPFRLRLVGSKVDCYGFDVSADGLATVERYFGSWPDWQVSYVSWKPRAADKVDRVFQPIPLPPDVDFASALVELRARRCDHGARYGNLTHRNDCDRVYLEFVHGPPGNCEFVDILITFPANVPTKDLPITPQWRTAVFGYDRAVCGMPPDMAKVRQNPPLAEFTRADLTHHWDRKAVTQNGPQDYFALVADASLRLPRGKYFVQTLHDDGIRVDVDGQRIIDSWKSQAAAPTTVLVELEEGEHHFHVEYFEHNREAICCCWIRPVGAAPPAPPPE